MVSLFPTTKISLFLTDDAKDMLDLQLERFKRLSRLSGHANTPAIKVFAAVSETGQAEEGEDLHCVGKTR